ncbi:MAG: hypothetical protein ACPGN3_10915 [Opitutales bacterium]
MGQFIQNIKVYFSDDGTELHPTVDNGFAIHTEAKGKNDAFVLNFLWGANESAWMSPASTGNLADYTISIDPIDVDYVYRVENSTGVLSPAGGLGGTTIQGPRIVIPGIPSGWDGIDFEYILRITGNANAGSRWGILDPRARLNWGK